MADKIYNRQAPSLSTNAPVTAKIDTGASEMLADRAKKTAEVASQNFVLGQKQVLNGIMDYGYEKAKDSPKQFLELTQSAFEKQAEGLPKNMREKMAENFADTQRNYLLKVENNFTQKQDDMLRQNGEDNLYALSQNMQLANQNLYTAMANDRPEDVKIARQALESLKNQGIKLSEIKLSNGSYVYAKGDREKIKSGTLYDPQSDFEQAVDGMSVERLREWDSSTFQNQQKWTRETGIDKKTYDSQSKYIASRLKALGDEEDRIVKSNAEFTAAALIPNFDPDTFEGLKKQGVVNNDLLDAIQEVASKPKSVSEVVNTYKLADTIKSLQPLISDTDDNDESNTRRFSAATKLLREYSIFAKDKGLDITDQEDYLKLISKGLVDKQFSDSLQPVFADSALKDNFFVAKAFIQEGRISGQGGIINTIKDKAAEITNGDMFTKVIHGMSDEYAKRNAQNIANDYVKTALTLSVAGDYAGAKKVLQDGNREVIKARSAPYLSKEEFSRLESDMADGKKAYFTSPFGGTFEFMGYSNKDAIFKAVK